MARRLVTNVLCISNVCSGFLVKYCKIRNWLCISNGEWGTGVVVNCYAGGKTKTQNTESFSSDINIGQPFLILQYCIGYDFSY